jgi:hypothetical protein
MPLAREELKHKFDFEQSANLCGGVMLEAVPGCLSIGLALRRRVAGCFVRER